MDYLRKLEATVLHWVKDIPHLPAQTRRWLGTNAWWIIFIAVIVGGIWALFTFFQLLSNIAILDSVNRGFLVPPAFVSPWTITTGFICLGLSVLSLLVAAFAVKPLQAKIKEGWVLLFVSWLILVITVILYAILSLNPLSFIIRLLFGAISVALVGYLLFEVHGQFAHNPKKTTVEKPVISEEK